MGEWVCHRCGYASVAGEPATGCPRCDAPAVAILDKSDPTHDGSSDTIDINPDLTGLLAPPEQPDEIGRLGPYRVLGVLGTGGMGVVFRAEDLMLGRPVALKSLLPATAVRPTSRQRFLREARATAAVRHPNVVTVYHVGADRGIPYLAMELLTGGPLTRLRQDGAAVPIDEVIRIGLEAAEGLAAAHAAELVHRDIKPANVWLEGTDRQVKILDFGLARAAMEDTQLTRDGAVVGTPAYMSPEQARGWPVDHRTDLYGLGAVLYWLCTGEPPVTGTDMLAVLTALALDEPVPVRDRNPNVPPALADLIARLLAKSPDDRPASANALCEELRRIQFTPDFVDDVEVVSDVELEEPEPAGDAPPLLPRGRMSELSGHALDRFDLEDVIARGHHGLVFRARDRWDRQPAAVKMFWPGFPRGRAEAETFAQAMQLRLEIDHPNLIGVRAAGRSGAYGWVAMDLVQGESLAAILARSDGKPAGWKFAYRVAVDVAKALEATAQVRLVHGDVSPRNILVRAIDGGCQLNDLLIREALAGSRLAHDAWESKLAAEAPYLAPEELEGGTFVDHLSDLYRLGVIVYTLLTGKVPFSGRYVDETFDQIRNLVPKKPRKFDKAIPVEFGKAVMRVLIKRQEERYQSPTEFLAALEPLAERARAGE